MKREKPFGRPMTDEKPLLTFHCLLTQQQKEWLQNKSLETGVTMNEILRRMLEKEISAIRLFE
ncbi:MAG TPA: hypothetical protein PLZ84_07455 [Clostridia bacterium]|nr:hypothetical protein [Clostridia bacterium]